MFISKYRKFMFAPDSGATAGNSGNEPQGEENGATATTTPEIDYKALFEQEKAERAKLKKIFDATASEIAELKKANKAKMSDEEKKAAELEEERKGWREMEQQLNTMKVEAVFAKHGYDEKDYSDVSNKLIEVAGNKASELAEVFVDFVKKANKNAVTNAKNGMIKDSAIPPKASTAKNDEHPYAQLATEINKPNKTIEEIKNYYIRKK